MSKKEPIKPIKSNFPKTTGQAANEQTNTQNTTNTPNTTYAAVTSKTQLVQNTQEKNEIVNQLTQLITKITSNEIKIKDALLLLLNLLPLIIASQWIVQELFFGTPKE